MLHEAGVIAMSPELGSASVQSMTFDITSPLIEAHIIMNNMNLPDYLIRKTGYQLEIKAENQIQVVVKEGTLSVEAILSNKGMSDCESDIEITAILMDGTSPHIHNMTL